MRQNPIKAAAEARGDGLGPIYRRLLDTEHRHQDRYDGVGGQRRPRYLLDALEAREEVTVPWWRIPGHLRPAGCDGGEVLVTPDM